MTPLAALARVITLPAETTPVRFPTTMRGSAQTALFHLTNTLAVDYSETATANQVLMLCSSPLNPVWGMTAKTVQRSATWNLASTHESSGSLQVHFASWLDGNAVVTFPMRARGHYWFYIPKGAEWSVHTVSFQAATAGATLQMSLQRLQRSGEVDDHRLSHTFTAGQTTVVQSQEAAIRGAWWRVASVTTTAKLNQEDATFGKSKVTLVIQGSTTPMFYPLMQCPDIANLQPTMESMRTNASGLLVSCTAPPLAANGTVFGGRILAKDTSVWTPEEAVAKIQAIAAPLRYNGPAAKGCYTYLPPTEASLSWTDYRGIATSSAYNAGEGVITAPVMCNDESDFEIVNFMQFTMKNSTYGGLTLQLRHDMHLEFITDSMIYKIDVPKISQDAFASVLMASNKMCPFTENPIHIATLARLGTTMLRFLTPYLIPVGKALIGRGAAYANDWLDRQH